MGKKKNKNGYGKGTFIKTKMILSPAFVSLGVPGSCDYVSSASNLLLLCLLAKRQFAEIKDEKGVKKKIRTDDNRFTLTYKEMTSKPLNITRRKATRAIDELLAKGFIEVIDPGGMFEKHKAVYGLVDDWKNWKPGNPSVRERKRDAKRGFQGKGLGAVKTNMAHMDGPHPHTRGRTTPPQRTHTWTDHTPKKAKMMLKPYL